ARTAPAVSTAGLNLARPSASDQRCVTLKEQEDLRWWAFNDCSFTVSYAWCVTGGNDQRFDCAATLPGLVSSTVATRGRTLTPYMGGVGRRHLFVCRAPATPHVREVSPGRFEHQCASPARAAAPARPATTQAPQ